MRLDHSCQVQRTRLSERDALELYETPGVAVRALVAEERQRGGALWREGRVWEPAAGRGTIARELTRGGFSCFTSDIKQYPEFVLHAERDFFSFDSALGDCEVIVTNPPFGQAERFVAHALGLAPVVIMLLRLAFLESERRRNVLEGVGLKRVLVFRKRLPMMHRDGWEGKRANSGMAFAWFVWERGWKGETSVKRISWEPFAESEVVGIDEVMA